MNQELTEKEKIIMDYIAQGKTYKEIATIESIAFNTVKKHLSNIYSKLNVSNKIAAINKIKN